MFKKFLDKHGVWNPEVECGEVRDYLAQTYPNWRFIPLADKGAVFLIEARKGILRMTITRLKSGRFLVSKDVSLKWWIVTLGVAGLIGEFTGITWQGRFMTELKHRFAIDKNAPQKGL